MVRVRQVAFVKRPSLLVEFTDAFYKKLRGVEASHWGIQNCSIHMLRYSMRLKNELEIFVGRSKNEFPDVWRQSQICERFVKQHFSQLRDPNISSGHWEIACSFKMILTLFFHLFCLQEHEGHWEHGLEVHLPGKTSVDKCCQELYWAAAF